MDAQNGAHELGVKSVSATVGGDAANNVSAREREVADDIERLVAYAFVIESQVVIDRPCLVEHEQVLKCYVLSDALAAKLLRLRLQQERSS